MAQSIAPDVLRQLRKQRQLSLDDLSRASGIDRATIHKIEGGKARKQRPKTIRDLSKALGVSEDVLTGVKPLQQPSETEPVAAKQQFNVRISDAVRNALILVSRRYRVPTVDIIEMAPLMFFLAAETSLHQRQHALSKALGALQEVEEAGRAIRHLPPYALAPSSEDVLDIEQRSIRTKDLFGREVDDAPLLDRDPDYDPYAQNPIVAFLSKELSELSPDGELSQWRPPVGPSYRICIREAEELVGGDSEAAEAILSGVAPLNELLKELKDSTPEERAKWAKDRSVQHWKEFNDSFELNIPTLDKEADA